ncbi:MAG: hypothetical protein WC959_07050 [Kiritimatiellales bacterium]
MIKTIKQLSKDEAVDRARRGLEFFIRHQNKEEKSAERGRFPMIYDCKAKKMLRLSTNWTTGVAIQACLQAWRALDDQRYLDAAGRGVNYLRSLQEFSPTHPRLRGVFHEISPQSELACPRDATTAAWSLLDWYQASGDHEALERSICFAEWFLSVGTERGFTYWNTFFNDKEWIPDWSGSFHIGEAIYFYRLNQLRPSPEYHDMCLTSAQHFVKYHLADDGFVTVAVDPKTWQEAAPDDPYRKFIPDGWEIMHQYNSDFAGVALACAHMLDKETDYITPAQSFLDRMVRNQRADGGYGPEEFSVRSAGGMVPVEMMMHDRLFGERYTGSVAAAMNYLADIQWDEKDSPADGAFLGMTDDYYTDDVTYNIRAASYAIMALIEYGTGVEPFNVL